MDPQGPPPNDDDRGPQLIAIFWVEAAVAILCVTARMWGRALIHQTSYDDYMMIFTLILFLVLASFVAYFASIGGCRHLVYLTPEQQSMAVKYNWISQPWGIFAFATGKISIALLLLRLIGPKTIWRKWILYSTIISVFIINALGCILTFVQCNPPYALWTPQLVAAGHASCWNPQVQSNYAMFLSCWNILIDVVLAGLPVTIVWNLQMPIKKKLGVAALLGLGLAAAICGIVKVNYLAGLNARSDLTWETYNLFAWSGSEIFVIMVCGSVPPMKPLYDHFAHKNGSRSAKNSQQRYYVSKSSSSTPSSPPRQSEYIYLEDQPPPPPDTIRKSTRITVDR